MEELESLDEKALAQEYINSYSYAPLQKALGCVLSLAAILTIIVASTVIFMSIIGYFSQ